MQWVEVLSAHWSSWVPRCVPPLHPKHLLRNGSHAVVADCRFPITLPVQEYLWWVPSSAVFPPACRCAPLALSLWHEASASLCCITLFSSLLGHSLTHSLSLLLYITAFLELHNSMWRLILAHSIRLASGSISARCVRANGLTL